MHSVDPRQAGEAENVAGGCRDRRDTWRMMFDHYVFRTGGDPVPYLPAQRRGLLGKLTPAPQDHLRVQLIRSVTKGLPQALGEPIRRLLWQANAHLRGGAAMTYDWAASGGRLVGAVGQRT